MLVTIRTQKDTPGSTQHDHFTIPLRHSPATISGFFRENEGFCQADLIDPPDGRVFNVQHFLLHIAKLKIISPTGTVEQMEVSKPVFTFKPFGDSLGKVTDIKLNKTQFNCKVKFSKEGWEFLRKATARVIKIGLSAKFPGIRKGEKVTLHLSDGWSNRDVTGVLYHIRKPYRDREDRIYYLREEFSGIPIDKAKKRK